MTECTLKDASYQGNCEFCSQRVDCMLSDILQKLKNLETVVAEKRTEPAEQNSRF